MTSDSPQPPPDPRPQHDRAVRYATLETLFAAIENLTVPAQSFEFNLGAVMMKAAIHERIVQMLAADR